MHANTPSIMQHDSQPHDSKLIIIGYTGDRESKCKEVNKTT